MQNGGQYETIMASGVGFYGMFLELWDRPTDTLAMTAYYSDANGSTVYTKYREDVPPEVEASFQAEAARRLPPIWNS